MQLAKSLSELLKSRGWSLAKLARASRVPSPTLHGWLNGRSALNLDQLKSVAAALEVSLHQLAFGEPDPFEQIGTEVLKEIFSGDVRVTLQRIERKR